MANASLVLIRDKNGPRPATECLRGGVKRKVASDHMASISCICKSLFLIGQTMQECTHIDWQVLATCGSSAARPHPHKAVLSTASQVERRVRRRFHSASSAYSSSTESDKWERCFCSASSRRLSYDRYVQLSASGPLSNNENTGRRIS